MHETLGSPSQPGLGNGAATGTADAAGVSPDTDVVLKLEHITKRFPGVVALDDVDFEVKRGEVHVLLGENGAGKSTLMKILSGAYQRDEGSIWIEGQPVEIQNARHAQELGIAIIYQTFNQVPHLSVAENLFLGREATKLGFIDFKAMRERAAEELNRIRLKVDLNKRVMDLSVAQRQMLEIAKALSLNSKILILDEPTSALTERETETLFEIMDSLRQRGVALIYISHRLEEVKRVGDKVTVLRDGKQVGSIHVKDAEIPTLIRMMVGRDMTFTTIDFQSTGGAELLRVEHLNREGVLHDINFAAHRGEIVSFFGLVGAGRTEVARAVFGVDSLDSGEIYVEGKRAVIRSPQQAVKHGLGFLTEDRLGSGLALALSVAHNMTLASLENYERFGPLLDLGAERRTADNYIKELDVQTPSQDQIIRYLSGGNQQKVVLAKWLMAKSKVLFLDEPTQGIDVGAKEEVHRLMLEFTREQGGAVVLISSDLPEVLRMSDRILVMREGRIVAEVPHSEATQEHIMEYAAGVK